ncbi:uncharacterized protein VTP21DRAFT_10359 [Calcarisporiella thermophila]|uniref:uncharacterized protein n=1 Tax=Calcarisporiella thermophila TaxID=911321 RepID=UPI0037433FB6
MIRPNRPPQTTRRANPSSSNGTATPQRTASSQRITPSQRATTSQRTSTHTASPRQPPQTTQKRSTASTSRLHHGTNRLTVTSTSSPNGQNSRNSLVKEKQTTRAAHPQRRRAEQPISGTHSRIATEGAPLANSPPLAPPPPPYSPVPEAGERLVVEVCPSGNRPSMKINQLEDMVSSMRSALSDQAFAMSDLKSRLSDIQSLLAKLEARREQEPLTQEEAGFLESARTVQVLAQETIEGQTSSQLKELLAQTATQESETEEDDTYNRICSKLNELIQGATEAVTSPSTVSITPDMLLHSATSSPPSPSHECSKGALIKRTNQDSHESDFHFLRESQSQLVNSILRVDSTIRTVDMLAKELVAPEARKEEWTNVERRLLFRHRSIKRRFDSRRLRISPFTYEEASSMVSEHYYASTNVATLSLPPNAGWLFMHLVYWTLVLTLGSLLFESWYVDTARGQMMLVMETLVQAATDQRRVLLLEDAGAGTSTPMYTASPVASPTLAKWPAEQRFLGARTRRSLKYRSTPRLRRMTMGRRELDQRSVIIERDEEGDPIDDMTSPLRIKSKHQRGASF